MERLRAWMAQKTWRRFIVVGLFLIIGFATLFGGWIGVALLRGSTEKTAGAVAFNIVLVFFMSAVFYPLIHRTTYRWYWQLDRNRTKESLKTNVNYSGWLNAELAEPPPAIRWTWALSIRHLVLHTVAVGTLFYIFLPFDNQLAIGSYLFHHSAGRASAGKLSLLLFGFVPLTILLALSMFLLRRQMKNRDAGLLDDDQKLLLAAELNWLFSYATSVATTMWLCRLLGGIVTRHL